jgi:serine/threonine protein kinase
MLLATKTLYKEYTPLNPLKKGGNATIWKVQHNETHKIFAMKKWRRNRPDITKARSEMYVANEIKHLQMLKGHPNIVSIEDVCEDEEFVYIIEELITGPSLEYYCCPYTEKTEQYKVDPERFVKKVVRGILNGIEACHDKNICHGDIKPSNIMLTSDDLEAKIVDFDCSSIHKDFVKGSRNSCCTPEYMPPEYFYEGDHGRSIDIWATGVLTTELLHGMYYNSKNDIPYIPIANLCNNRRSIRSFFKTECTENLRKMGISEDASDFLKNTLCYFPPKRWSAKALLNHDWLL